MADKLTNWEDVKKPFENMNLHVEETEGVTKETMNQLEDVHAVMLGQSQHLEFELGQQYKYPVDAIDDSKATKNLKKKWSYLLNQNENLRKIIIIFSVFRGFGVLGKTWRRWQ